jgi:transposase
VAQARLSMRKIREVLRLTVEAALSDRQVARAVGASRSTVQECLRRCREARIGWPPPAELHDAALIARLYRRVAPLSGVAMPDFPAVHRELGHRGVTRLLLWQEYKAAHPQGVQYTAFCIRSRRWLLSQELVFRQVHAPGDKLFADYAAQSAAVTDRTTGEIRDAQVFLAVLGASNYSYAEATWTQALRDTSISLNLISLYDVWRFRPRHYYGAAIHE